MSELESTIAFIKAHFPKGLVLHPKAYAKAIEAGIPADLLIRSERIPTTPNDKGPPG